MRAVMCLVPVAEADDPWLSRAETDRCAELGMVPMRSAARIAAKRAVAQLMPPGFAAADLTVERNDDGSPRLRCRVPTSARLPKVSLSHSAGWAAALAWLP